VRSPPWYTPRLSFLWSPPNRYVHRVWRRDCHTRAAYDAGPRTVTRSSFFRFKRRGGLLDPPLLDFLNAWREFVPLDCSVGDSFFFVVFFFFLFFSYFSRIRRRRSFALQQGLYLVGFFVFGCVVGVWGGSLWGLVVGGVWGVFFFFLLGGWL